MTRNATTGRVPNATVRRPERGARRSLLAPSGRMFIVVLLLGACSNPAGVAKQGVASVTVETGAAVIPEIKGQRDPALLEASQQAAQALVHTDKLFELAADDGIDFYPAFACKPNSVGKHDLSGAWLESIVTIETCHEDQQDKKPQIAWLALLDTLQQSPALLRTQRISLDERSGIGIDTGTSYLVENTYKPPAHRIVAYFFLGTADAGYRDWDEIGFVFSQSGSEFRLVAVYHDYFSSI